MAVGGFDGELAVGSEGEDPAAFVGGVVVLAAQRKEIGEIGWSAVAPPVDVMGFGVVERDVAAGHGACGVDGTQGAALGAVGESGGTAEVQLAVGVDHGAVAHDHWPDGGVGAQVLDPHPGDGDGDPPVDGVIPRATSSTSLFFKYPM